MSSWHHLSTFAFRKVFGTGVGPSRRPVDAGSERWHYNGIRRRDGIVMPPLPDKKRGGGGPVRLNNTVPIYTPTPVLPPVNSISAQVTSEGRAVGTIIGAPQLVTTSASPSDAVISPSSPILKAQLSAPLRPSPPPPARPPQVRCVLPPVEPSLTGGCELTLNVSFDSEGMMVWHSVTYSFIISSCS